MGKYRIVAQWNSKCFYCGKTINEGDDAFLIGNIWIKPARVKRICFECGNKSIKRDQIHQIKIQ